MADWFAISLRWIILVALTLALGSDQPLSFSVAWPLGVMAIWNLVVTAFASLNTRIPFHRYINIFIDLVLAGLFFIVQGGLNGPANWVGFLPVVTAAIYYEFTGSLITAAIFSTLIYYLGTRSDAGITAEWNLIATTIGISALLGLLAQQAMIQLRKRRVVWVDAEEKKRAIQNERLRAIYELTSTLSSTLSYKRVLDSALDMSAAALNPNPDESISDPLVGAVLLFKGGKLRIGSARRFTHADTRSTFDGAEGVLKHALDEGDPIIFTDIGYDPELGKVIALRNCVSGYCFPLRSGFNVYGVLLFAHPEADYFNPERLKLLDIIGRQAVIAIQNARLYQDLVEEKERMVEVHEEARKKLARDLHDGPTQSIAAMAMRLNILRRMIAKDINTASSEVVKLEEMAHRTTKEIRHMLFTLRPLILESQGLTAAVQSMADKMMETFSQKVTVNIDDHITDQLEMGKQGVIFYIIEEAVNNARKHASASTISVNLRRVDAGIALLEIMDNGIGFDMAEMTQAYDKRSSSSLGMVNLRERTELVSGHLQIDSAPGKGTRVQVYIPLTEEAVDRIHHPQR